MIARTARRHRGPAFDSLETRQPTALVGPATAAVAIFSSPLLPAARTAATAYQVGQLAYTGRTTFLLGSVRVDQPFALKNVKGLGPKHHQPPRTPAFELPSVRLQRPPLLETLGRVVHHPARGRGT